jgi:hypothetical protein
MDQKDWVIRELAAARGRGDFEQVRSLLADEIVWHEPGEADYSGDHRNADDVIAPPPLTRTRLSARSSPPMGMRERAFPSA